MQRHPSPAACGYSPRSLAARVERPLRPTVSVSRPQARSRHGVSGFTNVPGERENLREGTPAEAGVPGIKPLPDGELVCCHVCGRDWRIDGAAASSTRRKR